MNQNQIREIISAGQTALGIEFGSTRIKAVLIGPDHAPLASGGYEWENRWENGNWTYPLEQVWEGLQTCYARLAQEVRDQYGVALETIGAIGFSAMMDLLTVRGCVRVFLRARPSGPFWRRARWLWRRALR